MSLLDSEIEVIDKVSIKELIIEWLKKYKITDYKINDDFTIDANWNVNLYGYPKSQLPDYIQFNEVIGWFDISHSNIKILKGCPKIVKGDFNCSFCSNLKTLKGSPKKVGRDFDCSFCSKLESLEGSPEIVDGSFDCYNCSNLKTLEGAPEKAEGYFSCSGCLKLKNLKGAPKIVNGRFYCDHYKNLKITESDYKKYKII